MKQYRVYAKPVVDAQKRIQSSEVAKKISQIPTELWAQFLIKVLSWTRKMKKSSAVKIDKSQRI